MVIAAADIMDAVTPVTYYDLGPYFTINKAIVMLFVAAILTFLFVYIPTRKLKLIPGRWQNAIESLVDFIREGIISEIMGEKGKPYFPLVATLFIFILFCNVIGLIPGSFTPTSRISITAAFALIVYFIYLFVGIKEQGFFGYLKTFAPAGIHWVMLILIVPIEVIGALIVRPFSLAVRLFANMLAGHLVLALFLGMTISLFWLFKPFPFALVVVLYGFELFIAALQAYIFAILAAIYIGSSLESEH